MIKIKFTLLDKTMELVQEDKPKQYQTGFTEGDIKALNYERYHHPHPRVQRKMEALWLKSPREPHNKIAQLTGISINVVT